jgi:two-component system C4-dicarboxylate transport sensor histidine kinase DctB
VRGTVYSGIQGGAVALCHNHAPPFPQESVSVTRRLVVLFALAAALLTAIAITFSVARARAIEQLRHTASVRITRTVGTLRTTLERYESLPYLVSTHPFVQDALAHPSETATSRANRYLEDVAGHTGAAVAYVIDPTGHCIAASNWREPQSFVGSEYRFRPYFIDAIRGGTGHFFGIGTRSHEPGYYLSQAVEHDGQRLGVMVVKLGLEGFPFGDTGEPLIVADTHGVIFLSSVPNWKYHTVRPLPLADKHAIRGSQQYADHPLTPLPMTQVRSLSDDVKLVRVGDGERAPIYLLTTRQLGERDWQLMMLTPLDDANATARIAAIAVGFAFVSLYSLVFYWRLRRARVREIESSRQLLQAAYAELNQRVEARTADLSAANAKLTTEVAERSRAEAELRAAQDELVQATKLAALGQMAAGITHELNQPLSALRTFSDNTRVLLERGEQAAAFENLAAIGSLTERMGRITNQLKLFVGKPRRHGACTSIAAALRNVLEMLHARLARIEVEVRLLRPDGTPRPFAFERGAAQSATSRATLSVRCDDLRVEQVLINLIGNAIDAVAHCATPRIAIEIDAQPDAVSISICDNGAGIAAEVLPRLFEPFFTTKEVGHGLGLGLAISSSIARDACGTLVARSPAHADGTGACFMLTLPRAYGLSTDTHTDQPSR